MQHTLNPSYMKSMWFMYCALSFQRSGIFKHDPVSFYAIQQYEGDEHKQNIDIQNDFADMSLTDGCEEAHCIP